MKIQLKTTLAGPQFGGSVGAIIDVPESVAYDLIERHYAVQAEPPAAAPRQNKAARRTGRTARRRAAPK